MTFRVFLVVTAAWLSACGSGNDQSARDQDYVERMAKEHRTDHPAGTSSSAGTPTAPTASQTVSYGRVNGQEVAGYLAYPAAAEGGLPAVLVFHEWWGLNDNIRAMANRLAAEGYVALAVDLYGGRVADRPELARSLMQETLSNPDAIAQHVRQAHAYLRDQIKATRIGTIGWCLGGTLSLRAALLVPDQIDATVVYYGHLREDAESLRALRAPVLGLFGSADEGIPLESVRRFEATLKDLGKPASIHVYEGAGHAFANPSGGNHRADAAADAWQKTVAFLALHLKNG